MREAFGVAGMSADTVRGFRDKPLMRERVAAAGLRVPRSERARSRAQAWAASSRVGFPLIVKPVAGAGSADTFRVESATAFDSVLEWNQVSFVNYSGSMNKGGGGSARGEGGANNNIDEAIASIEKVIGQAKQLEKSLNDYLFNVV